MQARAGVAHDAARLSGMLGRAQLTGGIVNVLGHQTFAVLAARSESERLWVSPLGGRAGFLQVTGPTQLTVHASPAVGDPLHVLPAGQHIGLVVVDFASRRRVRINGVLTRTDNGGFTVDVEQAYGNCPKYIQQRILREGDFGPEPGTDVRLGTSISGEDIRTITSADTFFLGTTNPGRGTDASHRGGPAGFVRVEGGELWWPDYKGNDLFNSFGNLAVDPEAAMLFLDFTTGRTLHLSGNAAVEWGRPGRPGDDGHTGRITRFRPELLVAGRVFRSHELARHPYPRNPALTD